MQRWGHRSGCAVDVGTRKSSTAAHNNSQHRSLLSRPRKANEAASARLSRTQDPHWSELGSCWHLIGWHHPCWSCLGFALSPLSYPGNLFTAQVLDPDNPDIGPGALGEGEGPRPGHWHWDNGDGSSGAGAGDQRLGSCIRLPIVRSEQCCCCCGGAVAYSLNPSTTHRPTAI